MAGTKVSALPAATTLAGTEVVPVVQGGSSKKATITQLLAGVTTTGTVTSVGLTLPNLFTTTGSPVTTTGTLTATLATQSANVVLTGPTSGSAAAPTFRALVAADLPATAVTAGSYTYGSFTVDAAGRLTAASSGTAPVTTVTGTAPIVSSGGATPAISISAASTGAAGSMSATDKTKLDGVATGATANSSDATLLARENHTGTQAGSTVTGAYTAAGLTMATARLLGRSTASTGPVEEFALMGLAFNSSNLATLADLVIPLSDETTALTASSSVAKVTIPYWPRATALTDLPIWAVATAPTGAALQFDIQVGGTSIYLPASGGTYPTIAISGTNSTASAGAFTTAFAAAPTIAVGSVVTFFVRQIGSTAAGSGLKVALLTRRAG